MRRSLLVHSPPTIARAIELSCTKKKKKTNQHLQLFSSTLIDSLHSQLSGHSFFPTLLPFFFFLLPPTRACTLQRNSTLRVPPYYYQPSHGSTKQLISSRSPHTIQKLRDSSLRLSPKGELLASNPREARARANRSSSFFFRRSRESWVYCNFTMP